MSIQHVCVLMLENRAFDHMLGFSAIHGCDAETGGLTQVRGLTGNESNESQGSTYSVSKGADVGMPVDPGQEFSNVLEQLCGAGVNYPPGGMYPPINGSGFVASYVSSGGGTAAGEVAHHTGQKTLHNEFIFPKSIGNFLLRVIIQYAEAGQEISTQSRRKVALVEPKQSLQKQSESVDGDFPAVWM
jgi:Phosphoesterase family